MLEILPPDLKKMNVHEFLEEYSGNLSIAFDKICLPEEQKKCA